MHYPIGIPVNNSIKTKMNRLIAILALVTILCLGQCCAPGAMDAGVMKSKARVVERNGSSRIQKGSVRVPSTRSMSPASCCFPTLLRAM